jgi:hypothetical protein
VVINQVNKSWDRNKENMDAYCLKVRKLENKFYCLEFHHVVCDNNVAADVLSKLGSTRAQASGCLRPRASGAIHPGAGANDH